MQQNQSYQIDGGAHGEHFQPKSHIKKLITYPLNPKISRDELGTSPSFLSFFSVPVKEGQLAVTFRMSTYTYVIHRDPPLLSPWFIPAVAAPQLVCLHRGWNRG